MTLLACAALLCIAAPARASDAHAAPAEAPAPKKLEVKGEHKAEGKVEAAPDAHAAKAPPPMDPLDRVRERLAEKLGAHKAPDAGNPNVLRVAAHPTAAARPSTAPVAARCRASGSSCRGAGPECEPCPRRTRSAS